MIHNMNIIQTMSEPNVTVRDLVKNHRNLHLRKGLIHAGLADNFDDLNRVPDEILIWDDEGNVFLVPVKNGIWFEPVSIRNPYDPTSGILVASLKETKIIRYHPMLAQKKVYGLTADYVHNNSLHFYRSEHQDCIPFLSLSPLWLLIPEFRDLLQEFSEGDFSSLETITEIVEPSPAYYVINENQNGSLFLGAGDGASNQSRLSRIIRVKNTELSV